MSFTLKMSNVYTKYYMGQCGRGEIGDVYKSDFLGIQRGRGLGSILGGLARILRPLFLRGLNAVKKQAVKTGVGILTDIGTKPFRQALVDRGREAKSALAEKAMEKLNAMSGNGINEGSSIGNFIPSSNAGSKRGGKKSTILKKIISKISKSKRKTTKKNKKEKKRNNRKKKESRTLDIFS